MGKILQVEHLKKAYGSLQAVRDISFTMEEGSLFAFLGPNGAGKSTTIDMITTFLKPDDGEVIINGHRLGHDDQAIRECIGAVFQESLLDSQLTVKENLMTRAALYGLQGMKMKEAIDQAVTACELNDLLQRKYGKLSGGQKRRCDIARALLIEPKILFLDEPTTGLDPSTRKMLWNVIRDLQKKRGMSVFLTTHYMEEAADANDVVIIQKGMIRAQGTPVQLKAMYAHDMLRLYTKDPKKLQAILENHYTNLQQVEDGWQIPLAHTMDAIPILDQCKDTLQAFEVVHGTLDDAFLNIMKEEN